MGGVNISTDALKGILPLIGGTLTGAAPKDGPIPVPPPEAAGPPPPPPPTPAQAGFDAFAADPSHQARAASAITAPGQPILPPPPPPPQAPAPSPLSSVAPMQPGSAAPQYAPLPTSTPTPEQAAGTDRRIWDASHQDQIAKPVIGKDAGKFSNIGQMLVAGLAGAAGGLKGNPLAGLEYVQKLQDYNNTLPEVNNSRYRAAVVQPKIDAANLADTASQTAQRNAAANKSNAQAASDPAKVKAKQIADAARLGSTPVYDESGALTGYAPDEQSQVYQKGQSLIQLQNARAEAQAAQADLNKSKNDPKSPLFMQAQARLRTAQQNAQTAISRLGLSAAEFGFTQEKFYNPQPTAAERGKGDLAQSAVDRVREMRAIVAKHPEYFGPGEGRGTKAQEWIGSQDPDAQTYLSAAQYLSDHSAGVFGGRGKYITEQLHSLTDPHYNPAALNASLDEAERAAQGFVKAGAVHGKGASPTPPASGGVTEYVRDGNGKLVQKKVP